MAERNGPSRPDDPSWPAGDDKPNTGFWSPLWDDDDDLPQRPTQRPRSSKSAPAWPDPTASPRPTSSTGNDRPSVQPRPSGWPHSVSRPHSVSSNTPSAIVPSPPSKPTPISFSQYDPDLELDFLPSTDVSESTRAPFRLSRPLRVLAGLMLLEPFLAVWLSTRSDQLKELIGVFAAHLGVAFGFFGILATLVSARRR